MHKIKEDGNGYFTIYETIFYKSFFGKTKEKEVEMHINDIFNKKFYLNGLFRSEEECREYLSLLKEYNEKVVVKRTIENPLHKNGVIPPPPHPSKPKVIREGEQPKKIIEKLYTEKDMLEASKYGYNFHKTTSFPNQEWEDSCIRNTQQWMTTLKTK